LFLAISLINAIVSGESFGCLESALDLCFPRDAQRDCSK
jgi:hypothetical protein